MMKKSLALVLSLMLLLSASLAMAETFKMGIDAEYPPFSYLDDSGEYAGFDVEMCKAVCEMNGWDLEIVPVNWDFKLNSLDSGEHDCVWSGMTLLDSMKEAGYVLSSPTMTTRRSSWSRKTAASRPQRISPASGSPSSWAPPARSCWQTIRLRFPPPLRAARP